MRASRQHVFKTLVWLLFLGGLWLVLDFTLTVGRRFAQIEENRLAFDRHSTGLAQHDAIDALVIGALTKSAEATAFYIEHLARLNEGGHLPAEVLAPARKTVVEARERIATAQGGIAGAFAVDTLASEATALQGHLQRLNTSMGILATFFDDYVTAGPVAAIRRLKESEAWIGVESVDPQSLLLRAWDEQATLRAELLAAEQAHNESAGSLLTRLWVSALAVVYCTTLLAVTLRARWHHGDPSGQAA